MSSLPSTHGTYGLTSLGVFALLVGVIISTLLLGSMIYYLKKKIRGRGLNQGCSASSSITATSSTGAASDDTKGLGGLQGYVDLEAIIIPNSPKMTPKLKKPRSPSRSHSLKSGRASLSSFSRVFHHDHHHKRREAKEKERVQISRPTRLLPQDSSYVIVQSPLNPKNDCLSIGSHTLAPSLHNTRSSRARSLDSKHEFHDQEKLGNSMTKKDQLTQGSKLNASNSQSSSNVKFPRKRTIVWFDDLSGEDEIMEASSHGSRSSRSNSLPTSSSRSSWEPLSPGSGIEHPRSSSHLISEYREAKSNLGSVSQLWLNYQDYLQSSKPAG